MENSSDLEHGVIRVNTWRHLRLHAPVYKGPHMQTITALQLLSKARAGQMHARLASTTQVWRGPGVVVRRFAFLATNFLVSNGSIQSYDESQKQPQPSCQGSPEGRTGSGQQGDVLRQASFPFKNQEKITLRIQAPTVQQDHCAPFSLPKELLAQVSHCCLSLRLCFFGNIL